MPSEEFVKVSVTGRRVRTPAALPLADAARVLAAASELFEAVAAEQQVDVRVGMSAVREGSAEYAIASAPSESRAKVLRVAKAVHAAVAERGAGNGQRVQAALARLESATGLGPIKVGGIGALASELPELRVEKPLEGEVEAKVLSLEYGVVAGVRDSRRGEIAIDLRPALGGERIEIFAGEEHAQFVAARYRKGIWCRVEFVRSADGRRRDLRARAMGAWEQKGLAEAVHSAMTATGSRLDLRSAMRGLDDDDEEERAEGDSATRQDEP